LDRPGGGRKSIPPGEVAADLLEMVFLRDEARARMSTHREG
jgi:hypothetical protein